MVVYYGKAAPVSGSSGGGSGDAVWGSITGTLSDQTDLANALAEKQDTLTAGSGIDITNDVISATGGSVSFDGSTINENASNELQALGVKEARTDTAIRFWHGTQAQYNDGGEVKDTYYAWNNPTITTHTISNTYSLAGCYGNGKYISLTGFRFGASDVVLYSTDGKSWNTGTMPSADAWGCCAAGNGNFVAIASNIFATSTTDTAAYSADGQTWTAKTLPRAQIWTDVCYGGGKYVAVNKSGEGYGAYSTDGETWVETTMPTDKYDTVIYGNGRFVASGGNNYNTLAYSDDGINWTQVTIPAGSIGFKDLAFGNGIFVGVNNGGTRHSTDGINWTAGDSLGGGQPSYIAFSKNCFVVIRDDANPAPLHYSYDGIHWNSLGTTANKYYNNIYGDDNGNFVSIGSNTDYSLFITLGTVYTDVAEPTTASTVYSDASGTTSALTITAVGTGTITLSDEHTYTYNADGNVYSYYTVGESYPNYVCFIDGIGVKIGTTTIISSERP